MRNNLKDVVVAIDLSKKTYRRIWLNFFWAFVYNIVSMFLPSLFFLFENTPTPHVPTNLHSDPDRGRGPLSGRPGSAATLCRRSGDGPIICNRCVLLSAIEALPEAQIEREGLLEKVFLGVAGGDDMSLASC